MRRGLALTWVLLALTACTDDATGPSSPAGVYTLRRLNASPLPYDHEGLGCCIYLSGSLELDGGRYIVALAFENRNNGLVATAMEWGTYRRPEASRIAFVRDSFLVAPLLLDVATVSADTLRLAFGGEGPGSPDQ